MEGALPGGLSPTSSPPSAVPSAPTSTADPSGDVVKVAFSSLPSFSDEHLRTVLSTFGPIDDLVVNRDAHGLAHGWVLAPSSIGSSLIAGLEGLSFGSIEGKAHLVTTKPSDNPFEPVAVKTSFLLSELPPVFHPKRAPEPRPIGEVAPLSRKKTAPSPEVKPVSKAGATTKAAKSASTDLSPKAVKTKLPIKIEAAVKSSIVPSKPKAGTKKEGAISTSSSKKPSVAAARRPSAGQPKRNVEAKKPIVVVYAGSSSSSSSKIPPKPAAAAVPIKPTQTVGQPVPLKPSTANPKRIRVETVVASAPKPAESSSTRSASRSPDKLQSDELSDIHEYNNDNDNNDTSKRPLLDASREEHPAFHGTPHSAAAVVSRGVPVELTSLAWWAKRSNDGNAYYFKNPDGMPIWDKSTIPVGSDLWDYDSGTFIEWIAEQPPVFVDQNRFAGHFQHVGYSAGPGFSQGHLIPPSVYNTSSSVLPSLRIDFASAHPPTAAAPTSVPSAYAYPQPFYHPDPQYHRHPHHPGYPAPNYYQSSSSQPSQARPSDPSLPSPYQQQHQQQQNPAA